MCDPEIRSRQPITVDPSTHESNHIQLALDIETARMRGEPDDGAVVLIELLDHALVRRIFLGFGALATDRLLRDLADRLKALLGPESRLYYVGVGRFAIATRLIDDDLSCLLDFLVGALKKPFDSGNFKVKFEMVIGLIDMREAMSDPWDALRKATSAAQEGREKHTLCVLYDAKLDQRKSRMNRALHDMADAINTRQFRLVFQPKIRADGQWSGVEALLRWTHPEYGEMSPADFIPLADDTELMVDITRWVVQEALDALVCLDRGGIATSMAVNVSSRNLKDPGFSDMVGRELASRDLAPGRLQIECTEYSAFVSDQCIRTLNRLKEIGVLIALDDFGSGYSNLASLQEIPIDIIKIDKSLIHCAIKSSHCSSILVSVVQMCKNLKYRITAEGIESASMMESLRLLEIDEFQGFHIARPMTLAELRSF